ncbi:MAG: prolyl oligopeptidase family serine peptidase [Rubripirellula sp.]
MSFQLRCQKSLSEVSCPSRLNLSWRFCFVTLFVTAAPLIAVAQDQRFESKHVAKLQYVTSAEISPDGKHVAYIVSVPRQPITDDDGPSWSQLHVTDLEGNDRPFIVGHVSIGSPHWSSDSKWIFYTAKRSGDDDKILYRIAVDGGESIPTLKHESSIGGFDLSPDGKSVAFLAKEKTDTNLKELQAKGFDQEIYEEDWTPTRVWIASIDTSSTQIDSKAEPRMLDLDGSALDALWNPSGQELAVVLAPTPSVDDSYMFKRAHVVDAQSGRVIRSIGNPGKLGDIAWSPDGKRLALVSGVDINDPREGRLMVTTIDGDGPAKDVLPNLQAHVGPFTWKDDSTIYWLAAEGVSSRFGTVTIDGSRKDLLQPGSDGDAVISDFSMTDSGSVVFVGHRATHPPEVYAWEDQVQPPNQITDQNPWLETMQFAKQVEIEWQARDGLTVGGLLVYPLNHVEGRRYPTIMYVHGGPESHESNGWITSYSRPGQVAAAQGFAVFYPNYRGSTGRGVEYSKMGQGDAAGKEFDDLVDGIDHLIELGITDGDAVGVTGGSYGGYASAWCSTFYSDRFAASVMFVGISDNVSKVGTTDIPEEMFLVHHLKRLWDDWDYFLERSPIRHVEKNKTPTLIMHGKNDPRVHPSQSLELHRHLKTLNQAPVRLVLFEGEGHGNRKAAARFDYNLRMLRWMKHFLQDKSDTAPAMQLDYNTALGISKKSDS